MREAVQGDLKDPDLSWTAGIDREREPYMVTESDYLQAVNITQEFIRNAIPLRTLSNQPNRLRSMMEVNVRGDNYFNEIINMPIQKANREISEALKNLQKQRDENDEFGQYKVMIAALNVFSEALHDVIEKKKVDSGRAA